MRTGIPRPEEEHGNSTSNSILGKSFAPSTADNSSDTYAQDSIDMLSNSAGIDFSRSLDNGIDQQEFGELLISSGLVLLDDITWITFTGGYDLGYLLKTMTSVPLPPADSEFFDLLTTFFPSVYGIIPPVFQSPFYF
jgi:CCR4-NOT transcription complex subunit 7/8